MVGVGERIRRLLHRLPLLRRRKWVRDKGPVGPTVGERLGLDTHEPAGGLSEGSGIHRVLSVYSREPHAKVLGISFTK